MWSLPPKHYKVAAILAVGLLILWSSASILTIASGEAPSISRLIWLVSTLICGIVVACVDYIWPKLWRWFPLLQLWLFPDLNGTWSGHYRSTWKDDGNAIEPIPVTITIRQKLFSTTVSSRTAQSPSASFHSFLERLPELKRFRIWYIYRNLPDPQFRDRSQPHDGVAYLDLDWDRGSDHMTGCYYTDRKTTGTIDVRRIGQSPNSATPPAA